MDAAATVATQDSSVQDSAAPAETGTVVETAGATQAATGTQNALPAAGTAQAAEMLTVMGRQIEASKVPPELLDAVKDWNKEFTQRSQELSGLRGKADALDNLTKHQGFRQWYAEQVNPQSRQQEQERSTQLTPEQHAELLSDPRKLHEFIEQRALDAIQRVAMPQVQQAQYEARTLRQEQEVSRLASQYKDFDHLNNTGKIEGIIAKYAKKGTEIDLEDAYWLAKRPYAEQEAVLKAQQRVQDKANGSTLPPSGAASSGTRIVAAKGLSMDEKLRLAASASLRGEKVQFDPSR